MSAELSWSGAGFCHSVCSFIDAWDIHEGDPGVQIHKLINKRIVQGSSEKFLIKVEHVK